MGLLNWNFMQQNPELVRMASNGFNHAGNSLNQFSSKLLELDKHNQALKESNAGIAYKNALTEGVNKQNSWVDKMNQASIVNMNAKTANTNASTKQTEIQNNFLPDYLAKRNKALGLQNRYQRLINAVNEGTLNDRIAATNLANQAQGANFASILAQMGLGSDVSKHIPEGINSPEQEAHIRQYLGTKQTFLDNFDKTGKLLPHDIQNHNIMERQASSQAQAQKEAQKQKARLEFSKLSPEQRVLFLNSVMPVSELGLKDDELGWAYDVFLDDKAIIRTTEGGSAFISPFPYNQKATNEIIKFYRNSPLHNMQKARDLDILKYHYELEQERGLQ